MSTEGLSFSEIRKVVEDYIGVNGGYLGDFSQKKHQEFYKLYCDLDGIDTDQYSGTTRERFINILKEANTGTQAKILRGVLDKYPMHSTELRTASRYDEICVFIQRLEATQTELEQAENETIARLVESLRGGWLLSVVGYFANHRPNLPYVRLDDEYKVQDLIFCLVSSIVPDLQFENPQSKNLGAVTYTRVDFSSKQTKLYLEVKHATSRHRARQIEKEISEDIVKYGRQQDFSTLIFFVYCVDYTFPNPRQFEQGFTGKKSIDDHEFNTFCIVKP